MTGFKVSHAFGRKSLPFWERACCANSLLVTHAAPLAVNAYHDDSAAVDVAFASGIWGRCAQNVESERVVTEQPGHALRRNKWRSCLKKVQVLQA